MPAAPIKGKIEYLFRPFELCHLFPLSYICTVTNNHIVMKRQESFNQFDLRVDALDYIFTQWLIRNHLYRKFARNLAATRHVSTSVRDLIRQRIRVYAAFPSIDYSFLLSGAFLFTLTPEGREFWNDASQRWADFCKYFFSNFTQPC